MCPGSSGETGRTGSLGPGKWPDCRVARRLGTFSTSERDAAPRGWGGGVWPGQESGLSESARREPLGEMCRDHTSGFAGLPWQWGPLPSWGCVQEAWPRPMVRKCGERPSRAWVLLPALTLMPPPWPLGLPETWVPVRAWASSGRRAGALSFLCAPSCLRPPHITFAPGVA